MGQCWERVKTGAFMGGCVGMCIGTVYGIYAVVRLRDITMGQRFQTLAKAVAGTAVSFGFFLAVGSAIRCEPKLPITSGKEQSCELDAAHEHQTKVSSSLGLAGAQKTAGISRQRLIAIRALAEASP